MKQVFNYADQYIQESDWKTLAMLKFCLFSMGLLAGMKIPEKGKKKAGIIAALIFLVTYIPLMAKFIKILIKKEE